jgi:hypothetical protein
MFEEGSYIIKKRIKNLLERRLELPRDDICPLDMFEEGVSLQKPASLTNVHRYRAFFASNSQVIPFPRRRKL